MLSFGSSLCPTLTVPTTNASANMLASLRSGPHAHTPLSNFRPRSSPCCSWLCPVALRYGAGDSRDGPQTHQAVKPLNAGSGQGSKRPEGTRGQMDLFPLTLYAPYIPALPHTCTSSHVPLGLPSPCCPSPPRIPSLQVVDSCSAFRFQLGCHLPWEVFPGCQAPGQSASPVKAVPSLW